MAHSRTKVCGSCKEAVAVVGDPQRVACAAWLEYRPASHPAMCQFYELKAAAHEDQSREEMERGLLRGLVYQVCNVCNVVPGA